MLNLTLSLWSWWPQIQSFTQKEENLHTLLASLLAASILFLWVFKKSRNTDPPLPPGPRGLPLLGYLPFLGTDLHRSFTDLAKTYGPIYKLWLGNKLCVVISSSELVRQVVRDQDAVFANRDPPISALAVTFGGSDIAFSNNGPNWRKLRKMFVREMLSNANLDYSGNKFHYLPFGSGRRGCAGLSLAERMLPFLLASFLHSFEWKSPEGEDLDLSDKFGIVIKKMKPLVAIPTPRFSNMDIYK